LHKFSLTPSRDTLSFYIVYMSHFVKPSTVKSYLSGIASFIEPYFPEWPAIRHSRLVKLTLAGCFKRFQTPTNRKRPLMESDLIFLFGHLSDSYDDTLFKCIVAVGWHNLHRAGELVDPDEVSKRDFRKRIKRTSVNIADDTISYMLPAHKGDRTFMGNLCVLQKRDCETLDPTGILKQYLKRRDTEHPYNPELFVKLDGSIPTRSWFIRQLRRFFSSDIAGHSLRSGEATHLAANGVPESIIQ
ncbi:hypothetical protein BT69DRAFT_1200405, partial [Atractiella rhizophila]